MTNTNLTELEALLAKATARPWTYENGILYGPNETGIVFDNPHDAVIIARARRALPGLIKELREARASEDRLAKALKEIVNEADAYQQETLRYEEPWKSMMGEADAALEAWKARKE